jgi:hypothetical protein
MDGYSRSITESRVASRQMTHALRVAFAPISWRAAPAGPCVVVKLFSRVSRRLVAPARSPRHVSERSLGPRALAQQLVLWLCSAVSHVHWHHITPSIYGSKIPIRNSYPCTRQRVQQISHRHLLLLFIVCRTKHVVSYSCMISVSPRVLIEK